ncbi:OmpP1/FadL family transporter [Paragemmobacter straminiformis]|uniref:Outer membrane protein transport protein n=1 Tax=Paragemmobacter straminiformis TaxID=2045119 RepID=A0A842I780_9RHOB|nr:outer membrane protein transport protein [Gemmobacter straminiformis]MBC2835476.1 outer membrane protein transport protein [Gemmobacter straminiformis]
MTKHFWTAALLLSTTTLAQAGGIDRSGQGIDILFAQGRTLELSYGRAQPTIEGTDLASTSTGDVAGNYSQIGMAYKADLTDKLSYAVILDQPFGADILYGGGLFLPGTTAQAQSHAATVLLRYKLSDNFAVHGGLRAQKADAYIALGGFAYNGVGLNGYNVTLDDDVGYGYTLGASYEMPEIALRVALTYNSEITHDFDTTEVVPGFGTVSSTTEVSTPQSLNLDAQSGIAADTLLFGQIRWVQWSTLEIAPLMLGGASLVTLDDTVTYTLGVGHKFNDAWSGAASLSYERPIDPAVSPLAPTDGRRGVTLAAIYTHENMKVTTALNYTKIGDAVASIGGTGIASMSGNSVLGVGVKLGFQF